MSFSFTGLSSPHAVLFMITELSPKPEPNGFHISLQVHLMYKIFIQNLMTSSSACTTFAVTQPVMSSKPYVLSNPSIVGADDGKNGPSHER